MICHLLINHIDTGEVTLSTEVPDASYIFCFDPLPTAKTLVIVPGDTQVNIDVNAQSMYTISIDTTVA